MTHRPAMMAAMCLTMSLLTQACIDREEPAPRVSLEEALHDTTLRREVRDKVARDSDIQPGALRTVAAAPVVNWTGPGGRPFEVQLRTADPASATARRFGTITLRTSARARTADIGQYPCTACHMGRGMVLRDERIADAHKDIEPVHPAQTGATCATCHLANDVEQLTLKSGERATLDHAYRLCAQCHYAQAEAWAGGAHGKRLDGWQGRRVVLGCADCHDPHNPAIQQRLPFRAPRLERVRGDQP